MPGGTTRDNLAPLDTLIATHRPQRLVCLGDFLLAASGRTPAVLRALQDWRARHRSVAMTWSAATTTTMPASRRPKPASTWWTSPG